MRKRVNLAYYHHYNRAYGWIGHFWQDRFKSQVVGKDEYFVQCGKYIELNPVRKKIVNKPEDYLWSSYKYYFYGTKSKILTEDFIYSDLGNNKKERQQKYAGIIIEDTIEDSYSKSVWGSDYQNYHENRKQKYHFSKK